MGSGSSRPRREFGKCEYKPERASRQERKANREYERNKGCGWAGYGESFHGSRGQYHYRLPPAQRSRHHTYR